MSGSEIQFHNVWGDGSWRTEAIEFWKGLNVLSDSLQMEKRAQQLVMVATAGERKVIGVTTAHKALVKQLNNNYFYNFRALVHPDYRIPGLVDKLATETIGFLENLYLSGESPCIGVITLVENKQLTEKRSEAIYPSTGLAFIGFSKKGHPIRIRYFKKAKI